MPQLPRLRTATKVLILIDGTILLFVQLSDLSAQIWIEVDENLADDVPLGTLHIDKFIQGILPRESEMVPWSSAPVPINSPQSSTRFS